MKCPICNGDLTYEGPYGYLASHQSGEILGYTYTCMNANGFNSEQEATTFLNDTNRTIEDLGVTSLDEITCDSSMHSVSGSFYTDKNNNLHNGYPC